MRGLTSEKRPVTRTVAGDRDLELIVQAAEEAEPDSYWRSGKVRFEVAIRPPIGLEPGCDDGE